MFIGAALGLKLEHVVNHSPEMTLFLDKYTTRNVITITLIKLKVKDALSYSIRRLVG